MPMFGESVESFLNLVIDHWDDLYTSSDFRVCCEALYELYHTETAQVITTKTDEVFSQCMAGLAELHKATGGTVKLKKHGFTEFHTNHSILSESDFEGEPYRIYINASTKNVIVLGRILIKLACLDNHVIYFKIADEVSAVDSRKDAIVVYAFGKDRASTVARQLGDITGDTLTPTSPGLTKTVAPGISIAIDPYKLNDEVSFGQHRVRPFATALLCYRDKFALRSKLDDISDDVRTEVFRFLLAGAFRAHGINALDPSSGARAATAGMSQRNDTIASAIKVPRAEQMAAERLIQLARKGSLITSL